MLDVLFCYARADREAADTIAAYIERGAEAKVWREECDPAQGETVAQAWETGLSSAAILLLLSPEAVPRERSRQAWHSVLEHLEQHASPPLGSVLIGDCEYARLLERRHFFRWSDGATPVLRALASWLVGLHPESETPSLVPARQPWFEGRAEAIDLLWRRLVDGSGTVVLANPAPGSGKTSLALEFARSAGACFRDVLWVDCAGRSPGFIAGDLESQLGIHPSGLGAEYEELASQVERHRVLLVLDDVEGHAPVGATGDGLASVLITTRSAEIELPDDATVLALQAGGTSPSPQPPAEPVDQRLWKAMAACRRNAFPLRLAAAMADLGADAARCACERLVAGRLADPLDERGARFRLSAQSRRAALSAADSHALGRSHATALYSAFCDLGSDPAHRRALIAELESGFEWALIADWDLATRLARRSCQFLKAEGRLREAARVYELLREAARARENAEVAADCSWELSWIRDEPGEIRRGAVADQQLALDLR
jgi:hypothetical protein